VEVVPSIKKLGAKLSWPMIWFLIVVLLIFAGIRAFDMFGNVLEHDAFEIRYLDHPIIASIHMVTGLLFVVLAPFQFSKKFRNHNLKRHRLMGRVLMASALIAGAYGIISGIQLPVYGGLASATSIWFFGSIFLFSVMRAWWCARNKKIAQHREWMIRALSIGLGVGTQRLVLVILQINGYGMSEGFGPALWLGLGLNLVVGEIWINLSRSKSN
jgi:uncharacterized membrane protein